MIQAAAGGPDAARRATGEPTLAPTLLADKVSGLTLTYAVLAALFHRERTGEGQQVEVPMTDALTAFMLIEHGSGAMSTPTEFGAGYQRILTPLRRAARTADGWISVFPYLDPHWVAILDAAGAADLAPEGGITRESLAEDPGERYRILEQILPTKTTAEWLAICSAAEIPAAEARDLDEIIGALPDDEHPAAGPHKRIPPPARLSASPASVRRPAPLIGEHNREVLLEVGFGDAEIEALEAAGVIRTRGSADSRR